MVNLRATVLRQLLRPAPEDPVEDASQQAEHRCGLVSPADPGQIVLSRPNAEESTDTVGKIPHGCKCGR